MPYKIDEYVLELDEEDITYFYRIFSAHDVEGTEKVPRKIIPKGSIGIAEKQTGIYNIESPGGWNIIGRTPLELFDKNSEPPIKIRQGDSITFYEVDINEFNRITNL